MCVCDLCKAPIILTFSIVTDVGVKTLWEFLQVRTFNLIFCIMVTLQLFTDDKAYEKLPK